MKNSLSFKELEEISSVGIEVFDHDERILCYSLGSEKIEGYKRSEVIGKKNTDVYGSTNDYKQLNISQPAAIPETFKTGKAQKGVLVSYTAKDKTTRVKVLCDTYPIFNERDEIKYVVAIYSDVADYLNLMDAMNKLRIELNRGQSIYANDTQYTFDNIIGVSSIFKKTLLEAKEIADRDESVLIIGETGTGKELFAQSIHNASNRYNKRFIAINCSAIPESLMESMLFGTCKGAFTGAINNTGLLEEAEGSTLFLDELNSMSITMQAKLLRVIETKKFRKVGSNIEQTSNIRFISAMNQSPREAIAQKKLRLDLYYRLGVYVLNIPPLRERPVDIRCLAAYYVRTMAPQYGKSAIQLADKTLSLFMNYSWQGNVRELKHVIMQSLTATKPGELLIQPSHLRKNILEDILKQKNEGLKANPPFMLNENGNESISLKKNIEAYERTLIENALVANGNNISKTAKYLSVSRPTLHEKIKKYAISTH
ncbi:MAG: sigma 54-interacting transcriptional regulator [Eubacterium sp.]